MAMDNDASRIPVTVLTGFLGSGKTTLLNRILTENHGRRFAVIENEFGEIGIDQALVINADEEIFEMNNGCICCTVRGDLIRILGNLMKRRDKFEHILVETTGMADPGPVAQTFFVDDEMRDQFKLDGIVTLVDAKHIALHIDDNDQAKEQVAFADVIVLNKIDLVTEDELRTVERRIRSMNAMARIHRATNAAVAMDAVLDVGGFDLERALTAKPMFLEPEYPFEWAGAYDLAEGVYRLSLEDGPDPAMNLALVPLASATEAPILARVASASLLFSEEPHAVAPGASMVAAARNLYKLDLEAKGRKHFEIRVPKTGSYGLFTQHLRSEFRLVLTHPDSSVVAPRFEKEFAPGHQHDQTVGSVGIHADGAVDGDRLNEWLGVLLREKGADIFRMKGILNMAGQDKRFVFQGVHMLFDGREDKPWGAASRTNDIVFIGRKLDRSSLEDGFRKCLV